MFIYQIGNQIVRGFARHSSGVTWRGKATQPEQGTVVTFNNYYSLPETTKLSLSGNLACNRSSAPLVSLNGLMKLGGKPYIDVVGYLPNECCCVGQTCSYCNGESQNGVHWFHTYGQITDISRDWNLDESSHDQFTLIPISIQLEVNPLWQPLNQYLWFPYYPTNELDTFSNLIVDDPSNFPTDEETVDNLQVIKMMNNVELYYHPEQVVPFHFEPEFMFYKKTFIEAWKYILYDPFFWEDWDLSQLKVFGKTWSSGLVTYTTEPTFNAMAKTMYCFDTLPTSGTLTITVQNEVTPFNVETSVSSIDLAQLHATLNTAEYGNTSVANVSLYVASDDIATSFVIKAGGSFAPLRSVFTGNVMIPNWNYPHRCPGELIGSKSKVTLTKPNVNVRHACLHIYRTV